MRIVMMGTGPFAVPTLEALVAEGHEIPLVITRPLPPARGRRAGPVNPVRDWAEAAGLPIEAPADINSSEAHELLKQIAAELFVVCDYGQILSSTTLKLARLGGINLHGSLLPRYRGAAPVHWAVYHGEAETGVTVIHMTPRLDAGPCLTRRITPIGPEETTEELEPRLAQLGIDAVREAISLLETLYGESSLGLPHSQAEATRAPRLSRDDGRIDWRRSATQIAAQVRAFQPWPGSFTFLPREGGAPLRLVLYRVRPEEGPAKPCEPGTVVSTENGELRIATGEGELVVLELQPEGKRRMAAADFLRGAPLVVGAKFDSA